MGKRERKIAVIKKYIANAGGSWPGYAYGNIPKEKARNACNSYAGTVEYGDILGLIDITVLGNGKKGMLFTENMIYYDNGMLGNRGRISYKSMYDSDRMPSGLFDSAYNTNALKEMVAMLAHIEGESFQNSINGTIDGITQGAQDIADTIEKGKELFNTIKGLFGN